MRGGGKTYFSLTKRKMFYGREVMLIEDEKKTHPQASSEAGKNRRTVEHWQMVSVTLALYDAFTAIGAYFFALWLRFDFHFSEIPDGYFSAWLHFAPIYALLTVVVLWALRLYRSIWRFVSFDELKRIGLGAVILGILHTGIITAAFERMPISYYLIGMIIQFMAILFVRFLYGSYCWNLAKRPDSCRGRPRAELCW